ncbi:hypothetical protein evm_004774 [Chilo suppressalis]|nr:hypothetical protein evm_004774 [Chilo suppressalis]
MHWVCYYTPIHTGSVITHQSALGPVSPTSPHWVRYHPPIRAGSIITHQSALGPLPPTNPRCVRYNPPIRTGSIITNPSALGSLSPTNPHWVRYHPPICAGSVIIHQSTLGPLSPTKPSTRFMYFVTGVCVASVVCRFELFFIGRRLIMERKVIRSAAREVILKVKQFCELEKKNNNVLIPLQNVQMRVAAMTGVSVKTVSRITKEGKTAMATSNKIVTPGKSRPQAKKIDLDDFDLCCIRQKIHFFYVVKKELPTVNKLRLELKRDINFQGSNTTLRRILKLLGFRFKRCQSKRKVLMERHDITAWRARYIERMRKNRLVDKRPVVYLDETYIHPTYHAKSCWQSKEEDGLLISESAGKRFIIAHAGTKSGFVKNALLMFRSQSKSADYHDDMNATNFLKWMTEKVVPNLPEKSLVVMDNAPYHCTQINKAPTMSSSKSHMQEWLRQKQIYFEERWTKPVLYDIIKRNKEPPLFAVDELLKQHNHEVVKLPPYHCDLNPIEKIWSLVKRRVADKNVAQDPKRIIELTEAAFASVTPEDWRVQCNHVEHLEDEYFKNDGLVDVEMERFIISTVSDSDTESDDSTEEELSNSDCDISGVKELYHDDHNYCIKLY